MTGEAVGNCSAVDSDHMGVEKGIHQENLIGTVTSTFPSELSPVCGFNLRQTQEKSDFLRECYFLSPLAMHLKPVL